MVADKSILTQKTWNLGTHKYIRVCNLTKDSMAPKFNSTIFIWMEEMQALLAKITLDNLLNLLFPIYYICNVFEFIFMHNILGKGGGKGSSIITFKWFFPELFFNSYSMPHWLNTTYDMLHMF